MSQSPFILVLGALCVLTPSLFAQPVRRYYTDEKLQAMRANLVDEAWARSQRDQILQRADRWAAYDDDRLRTLVIPPQVPRGYDIHNNGCPVHGVKANEKGLYKWDIDFDRPFKIRCPHGDEEYPSNDFAAFLATGMTDRSLLTGDYADDGWGWQHPDDAAGKPKYWFVAYYAHWSMRNFLMDAIESLGQAALVSEDSEKAQHYAHKASLLLWQLAVHYPDYLYTRQGREAKEHNASYDGKLWNMIWETRTPIYTSLCYDAVRPFLLEDQQLAAIAGLAPSEVDQLIRDRLLLHAAGEIVNSTGRIIGNYGMHQRALITLALVLDEKQKTPTSQQMIDWLLANPAPKSFAELGMRDALETLVHRDGVPHESGSYNNLFVRELTSLAADMVATGTNLFLHPRFRKLVTWQFDIVTAGEFTPAIGDSGDIFSRGRDWNDDVCAAALPYIDDPRLAWVARNRTRRAGDLLAMPPKLDLSKYPEEAPVIGDKPYLLPGHGLANLQQGAPGNWTASSLFFGSWTHHIHHDQLNLMIFAHGNCLLMDIGYPEQTDSFNHRRFGFMNNTIAHNTVTVDATKQNRGKGVLRGFEPNGFAQFSDAEIRGVYPNVSLYRRANLLIEAVPGQSYIFDVFHVRGGHRHDYAAYGTQAEVVCEPDLGPVRTEGTLAGADVPYEYFFDDDKLRGQKMGTVPASHYRGSGYQFLRNVQQAALNDVARFTWHLTEPKPGQPKRPWQGIALRAHILGDGEQLFSADGIVQDLAYMPESVRCFIRRREGENLTSRFMTVYEPFHAKPFIERVVPVIIEPEDGHAAAALVELADGSRHYVFHSLTPDQRYLLDGKLAVQGHAAVLDLDKDGQPRRAKLIGGRELRLGDFVLKGRGVMRTTITDIDYASGVVELADDVLRMDQPAGQAVCVAPSGFGDALTLRKVLSARKFSIGDEDTFTAGGTVQRVIDGQNAFDASVSNMHARPGMMVLNAMRQPVGRLRETSGPQWRLDRDGAPLTMADFPTAEADSGPRFLVTMAAVGDAVEVVDVAVLGE